MRSKVYVETTIPSYLVAFPARDIVIAGRQEVTREWWGERRAEFDLFVSPFVIDEIERGDIAAVKKRMDIIADIPALAVDDLTLLLTNAILAENLFPEKAAADAAHIAVATRHGMDFLLTWNCKHIANAQNLRVIERVMEREGFETPIICTPDELMGGLI